MAEGHPMVAAGLQPGQKIARRYVERFGELDDRQEAGVAPTALDSVDLSWMEVRECSPRPSRRPTSSSSRIRSSRCLNA
jgi:hypothetical protein